MKILTGLFDNMIMQRSRKGLCNQMISGISEVSGRLSFRVVKGACPVRLKEWTVAGRAANGHLHGQINGIPTGGSYDIELRVEHKSQTADTLIIKNVLVGDVWVLAGQSNMEGYGIIVPEENANPFVRVFYMSDRWKDACEPLHTIYDACDQVHKDLLGINPPRRNPMKGAGLGIHFGKCMYKETSVPQGLIPCAHGGTSMAQWSPRKKNLKGSSLYGAMLRRIWANGGQIAGILWYQGCSEATREYRDTYTKTMINFIGSVRKDVNAPSLPFIMAQIARTNGLCELDAVSWNSIQDQQLDLMFKVNKLVVIPTVDLTLDDQIHLDHSSCKRLGRRFALGALSLTGKKHKSLKPIAISGIKILKDKYNSTANIRIHFSGVQGNLISDGSRPDGFGVLDLKGMYRDVIYKCILNKNTALLKTSIPAYEIGNYKLCYGYSTNPFCNITDQQDRSLPVFKQQQLGKPVLITDFVTNFFVSKPLELAQCPKLPQLNDKHLQWQRKIFNGSFANVHEEFAKYLGRIVTIYFGCRIKFKEDMNVVLLAGYDGPVKIWLDGKLIHVDSKGTNPALPGDASVPCKMSSGTHDLVISLDSNKGSAYGIFLRFERKDKLSRKKLVALNQDDWPHVGF